MTYDIAPKICVHDYGTDNVILEVNSKFYNGKVKIDIENKLIQYFDSNDISFHRVNSEFEEIIYDYGKKKLILHNNKFKEKVILSCIVH